MRFETAISIGMRHFKSFTLIIMIIIISVSGMVNNSKMTTITSDNASAMTNSMWNACDKYVNTKIKLNETKHIQTSMCQFVFALFPFRFILCILQKIVAI